MRELTNFVFFKSASAAAVSGKAVNCGADILSLQVSGTFTSLNMEVQGRVDVEDTTDSNFVPMYCLNVGTMEGAATITEKGVYEIPVEGQRQVRIEINSISGGTAQAFGRFIDSCGTR